MNDLISMLNRNRLKQLLCLLIMLFNLSNVYAQNSPQEAGMQLQRLIGEAKSYYENLDLDQMNAVLDQGIAISRRFPPINPQMTQASAMLHLLKGLLVFARDRNNAETKKAFIRALQIDPRARLNDEWASPSLNKIFQEAQSQSYSDGNQGGGYGNQGGGYGNQGNQGGYGNQGGGYGNQGNQGGYGNQGNDPYGNQGNQGGYGNQGNDPYGNQGGGYGNQGNQGGYGNQGNDPYGNQGNQGGYGNQGNQGGYGNQGNDPYGNQGNQGGYGNQGNQGGYGNQGNNYEQLPDITHAPPAKVPGGRPLELFFELSPTISPQVAQATLYYMSLNRTQQAIMQRKGPHSFVGVIPARDVAGKDIQYYAVLFDQNNQRLSGYKTPREPAKIQVVGGKFANGLPTGGTLTGDENNGSSSGDKIFSFSLNLGTGFGTISKDATLVRLKEKAVKTTGFAFTPFHIQLEGDFWLGNRLTFGVFTRLQIVEFAGLYGGRLKFVMANNGTNSWILRAGGGYGEVRHLVKVQKNGEAKNDTTLEGPYFYSLGFSFLHQLDSTFAFRITTDFMHLLGKSPSLQFDLTLGIEMGF